MISPQYIKKEEYKTLITECLNAHYFFRNIWCLVVVCADQCTHSNPSTSPHVRGMKTLL